MNAVHDKWVSYRDTVVPVTAGEVQLKETQRAFYAGAHVALLLVLANGDQPLKDGVRLFEELSQECVQFARTIDAGEYTP